MRNPLVDNEFLKKLHEFTEREVYAKVIVLDLDEQPIEKITGRVTQGSISVDGTSAVRRTCSLTLVAQDVNINEYYWGMNSKIQLYIGLKNFVVMLTNLRDFFILIYLHQLSENLMKIK